ncbi:hypothetical protein AAG906_016642 [Vitis piasezkii]
MSKKKQSEEELLQTLGDFTSKENWDKFFTIRGSDDSFEWYAEWPQLKDPLLSHLSSTAPPSDPASAPPQPPPPPSQILVPGCGNSRLSEHLYDAGFHGITNVDFSKVVISDMLRRNVRSRPDMRWRVMDITSMQFPDGSFDAILDKGGLDALMEPELGPKLGKMYLTEFRFGWKMSIHVVSQKPSNKPSLLTFMVVAEKESSTVLHQITTSFARSSLDLNGNQARGLYEAIENENRIRREYSNGSDLIYSLEDLQLGAKGDLLELSQGRRFQLTLGEYEGSRFSYRAVVLDARQMTEPFLYHCGVFLVPKTRAHEWLFSSEEGQWMVVESSKAARLIMVLLDTSHTNASMDDIQKDLSPLVKRLAPANNNTGAQIPFMIAGDGIKQRKIVHQVTSTLTGLITVEDVVYENVDGNVSHLVPSKALLFRLTFQRAEGLVQSEALLTRKEALRKLLVKQRERKVSPLPRSSNNLKVYHNYLASSYHMGIISGFMLISSYLESVASTGRTVKAVVIGLGAGLLPMFLHGCMPFLDIEVVELDPVILNLARNYFGFCEDKHLKVHISDGIQFVREVAADGSSGKHGNNDAQCDAECPSSNGSCTASHAESKVISKFDILIIDVDSSDSSSGMTCPAADFVDESFLLTVKDSLSDQGLFVVNLVSRSRAIKNMVVSRMKAVFSHLFCLQLEEDVNEEERFAEAAVELEKLLSRDRNDLPEKSKSPEMSQIIRDSTEKIKCLK